MDKPFVTLLILCALLAALFALPLSLYIENRKDKQKQEELTFPVSTKINQTNKAMTFTHDDHKFILVEGWESTNLLHHPDCPKCKGDK